MGGGKNWIKVFAMTNQGEIFWFLSLLNTTRYRLVAEVKSRTQGSRPRTALPRTDLLQAKDQGYRRKCSQKKKEKSLEKIFSGDLQKKEF